MDFTDFFLVQRGERLTHIQQYVGGEDRAICGTYIGPTPSWLETFHQVNGKFLDAAKTTERDPFRYVDCERCRRKLTKALKLT
jgi:hypothetical protein